jgi:hypothetical protein
MTVSATGLIDFPSVILQRSQANRGEALIQLMDAMHDAERAVGKPFANIAEVHKIDISA